MIGLLQAEHEALVRDAGRWRKVLWLMTEPAAAKIVEKQLQAKGLTMPSSSPTAPELLQMIDALEVPT